MTTIKTHNIFINSTMRTSGSINDFSITLKEPLTLRNSKNFFRVHVSKAIIPNTISQINSTNDIVYFRYTKNAVNTDSFITLIKGNCNILFLLNMIKQKIIMTLNLNYNLGLNFTYDSNTSYTTFNITGTDNVAASITIFYASNPQILHMLGFTSDIVFSYDILNVSTDASSVQNVNINPINSLYIRSNNLMIRESYESICEYDVYSDILCKIMVTSKPNCYIYYNGESGIYNDLTNQVIDKINIYLSTNLLYEASINLNYTISLIFEEIGTNDTHNLIDIASQNQNIIQTKERHSLIDELKALKQSLINQNEEKISNI